MVLSIFMLLFPIFKLFFRVIIVGYCQLLVIRLLWESFMSFVPYSEAGKCGKDSENMDGAEEGEN